MLLANLWLRSSRFALYFGCHVEKNARQVFGVFGWHNYGNPILRPTGGSADSANAIRIMDGVPDTKKIVAECRSDHPGSLEETSSTSVLLAVTSGSVMDYAQKADGRILSFVDRRPERSGSASKFGWWRLPHNTGNFIDSELSGASMRAKKAINSVSYEPIPYASEQGIFGGLAGN
jgi:hypothetical protein